MPSLQSLPLFILAFLACAALFTTAQLAPTTVTDLTCEDATTYAYTPSQAAQGFCESSANAPCQNAFTMGYPNMYGPVGSNANAGPFQYNQQLAQSPLYIVLSGANGLPAYKTRFFLQVDRYSLLELGGTAGDARFDYDAFPDNAFIDSNAGLMINGTVITAEFAGWATTPVRRAYVRDTTAVDPNPPTNEDRRVVEFYTLVIELDRGVVSDFFWETGCYGCGSSACWDEEQWCTIQYSECSNINPGKSDAPSCNIKLYVGWRGTDVNGNYLMSAQQTMRNFLQFDVTTPFESARSAFGQMGPSEE